MSFQIVFVVIENMERVWKLTMKLRRKELLSFLKYSFVIV
nr:MAG TPA: hypothetical protein [Caudoviricetes sp.]